MREDFERIYAKYINFALQHGYKPTLLKISLDTWLEYSKEIRDEIRELGLGISIEMKPYILKVY